MELRPTKRNASSAKPMAAKPVATSTAKADDGLGRGMEFAIVVLAFLGVGYVLDRALGTKPLFMIVLVVLSLVGQFASMWYGYDARMRQLEAERLAAKTDRRRSASTSSAAATSAAATSTSASSMERIYAPAVTREHRDEITHRNAVES